MKAEKPAKGISVNSEFNDAVSFRINCECTDPDHDVIAWIEINADDEMPEVIVELFADFTYDGWKGFKARIADAWGALCGKPLKRSASLILTPQAAYNVQEALRTTAEGLDAKFGKKHE